MMNVKELEEAQDEDLEVKVMCSILGRLQVLVPQRPHVQTADLLFPVYNVIGSQEWPRIWSGNQMKKRTFSPWCGNLRLAARSFGLRIVMRQVLVFNRGSVTNDIEILSIVVFNAKLVQRVLQSEVQRELWSGNVQAVVKSSMVFLPSILLPATTLPPVNIIVIEFITTVYIS